MSCEMYFNDSKAIIVILSKKYIPEILYIEKLLVHLFWLPYIGSFFTTQDK